MKNKNLTIYTFEHKDGKAVNQLQCITKLQKANPINQRTKASITFYPKNSKNNIVSVKDGTSTSTHGFHTTIKKDRFKKANSKPKDISTSQNETSFKTMTNQNKFINESPNNTASKTNLIRNKSSTSTKIKKHNSISSCQSISKQNKNISKNEIEDSIGEIIKLKNEYIELQNKPAELDKQKQDIIDYYQNQMSQLNQMRQYYLTQKNNFTLQQDQNNQMFTMIKAKYTQLIQTLTQKENTLNDLREELQQQHQLVNKEYEDKELKLQNYYETRYKNYEYNCDSNCNNDIIEGGECFVDMEKGFERNVELNEEERENVAALMRAVFSVMEMSNDKIEECLFFDKYEALLNKENNCNEKDIVEIICNKIWGMVKPYCGFMNSKGVLYSYLMYLYNKTVEEKEEMCKIKEDNIINEKEESENNENVNDNNEENNYNNEVQNENKQNDIQHINEEDNDEIIDNDNFVQLDEKTNSDELQLPMQMKTPVEVVTNEQHEITEHEQKEEIQMNEEIKEEEEHNDNNIIEENDNKEIIQNENQITEQQIPPQDNNNNIEDEEEPIQQDIPQEYKPDSPTFQNNIPSQPQSNQDDTDYPLQQPQNPNQEITITSDQNQDDFQYNTIYLFRKKLLTTLGTIPYYSQTTIDGYNSIIQKLFLPHKSSLLSFLDAQSLPTQPNIISLSTFNEFITSNSTLTSFFLENPGLYQFLLFYLKYSSDQNLNLLDLNFTTLITLIDCESQSLIEVNYIEKIMTYLKQTNIPFDEFINPLGNHIIEKEGICYVNVKIFELLLKLNDIIPMNKQLNLNDSHYINVTELNNFFSTQN